jgi:hypothetical protein
MPARHSDSAVRPGAALDRLNGLTRSYTSAVAKSIRNQMLSCGSGDVMCHQTVVENVVFSTRIVVQGRKSIVGGVFA